VVIATILREEGNTGVQTHVQQVRRFLHEQDRTTLLVTPFAWRRPLTVPVFGVRMALDRFSGPASVSWYRHWHEVFLRNALRRHLVDAGACVIYAQCPLSARAALRARQGPHQRVILTVHFRISQADEWADKQLIKREGTVFRGIRQLEREVIPRVDGAVFVSTWAREALLSWFPEAEAVPFAVISNFVTPSGGEPNIQPQGDLVTIGSLEPVKNHRYLLQVLAEAKRVGHNLTLDVFGDGPLRNGLVTQARSLGIEEQVRFRGFRPDVRDFLPGYRVYVHASYSESSSFAIMEAMAAGLPIVSGRIGPLGELFDDGVEGRFWTLEDPVEAASTLVELVDSEPTRLEAAAAAETRFHRDYNAEVIGPQLVSFLARAETQTPAPPSAPLDVIVSVSSRS
jgi:glycosyltransferase involved in cell wall biosynthesis